MNKRVERTVTRVILLALILFVSNVASNRLYFDPLNQDIASRQAKLDLLKRENDQIEGIKLKADELEKAVNDAERKFNSLKPLLPDQAKLPAVFDYLTNRAAERNLKLERFTDRVDFQNQSGEDSITELPLQIEIAGSYDNAIRFLEDFSRFQRVLVVKSTYMYQEPQQSSPSLTMRAKINFSAFASK